MITEQSQQEVETKCAEARENADQLPYIVGIGASAGGLDALERLFDQMPPDTGASFIVVQHLSPDFKSLMDELLGRHTKMPIRRVEDGMVIKPNEIYLIPPRKNMVLSCGKLLLTDQDSSAGLNRPIDIFFRSLAQDAGDKSVAIILSGTGSDGSRGLQDVHDAGGLVIVQDTATAAFDGMPRSAVATGLADVVSPVDRIPEKVLDYISHPTSFSRPQRVADEDDDESETSSGVATVFRHFRSRYCIDFTYYKPSTIERRLERRVQMARCTSFDEYLDKLETDKSEFDALYRDLLVEVTQFFRDSQAFSRLRKDVIRQIVDNAQQGGQIRVWTPGCATGEEAYSLAILFDEAKELAGKHVDIKIFATDLHQTSLETASVGVYPKSALNDVPDELRERYFIGRGELIHVVPDLRRTVIFAPHDITRDPPFTKIDFISCRNLLIYLQPEVQRRILSLFHFGLKVDGVMFLGSSESVGELAREFEIVDPHWRIYRKLRDVRLPDAVSIPLTPSITRLVRNLQPLVAAGKPNNNSSLVGHVLEDLLDRYVPPSLLVSENYELIHSFGDASGLLSQPKGRPTLEVLKMVNGDLRTALSAGLHRATREKRSIVFEGVRVSEDQFKIVIEPYQKRNQAMFLVRLEPLERNEAADPQPEDFRSDDAAPQRIVDLERELDYTRESLQTTVEELESSNEELQATNEEMVSANEELQSTNEELHSVNEELYTVNAEHQRKIEELTELTSDMDNLFRSTQIATIFLDRELRIRKFTPAISAAFSVLEQDIGRPIQHIAYNLENPNLLGDVQRVMATGEPAQKEARSWDGKTYLERILAYRTLTGEIDGVVITFIDITELTEAYNEMRDVAESLELSDRDLQDFAYAVSHDLQAPLRHIVDHARRFHEAMRPTLNGDDDRSLQIIEECAAQMRSMIQGLLEYSRVYTRGGDMTLCSLENILDESLGRLKESIVDTNASISRDKLPVLTVDRLQLVRVFEHLLDNSLKYSGDRPPEIEIKVRQEREDCLITISDNGIGILPQHLERVFVIFQRLGFKENITGNGIGLALCRRIVRRHKGDIGISSDPGKATSVWFRLPLESATPSTKSS